MPDHLLRLETGDVRAQQDRPRAGLKGVLGPGIEHLESFARDPRTATAQTLHSAVQLSPLDLPRSQGRVADRQRDPEASVAQAVEHGAERSGHVSVDVMGG